jgi:putative transposase
VAPVSSPPSATSTGSVRLRLNPTNAQAAVFVRAAGARRFAFNWDLAQIKANQDQRAGEATYDIPRMDRTRPFSYFDLVRRWDAVKHAAVPWHVEQSVWTFRYPIRAAPVAHSRFLKRQSRFPRFKARHRDRPRFTTADGLGLQPGRLRVAKYGWVALAAPCRAQAQLRRLLVRCRARILNITVSRDAGGTCYASVCFERTMATTPQMYSRSAGAAVGVDVGVRTAAVVATAGGTLVADPGSLPRDAQTHLKHLQRALSRTQKGSANRPKPRRRLGRAHARVGAARASRLHQFTAALAKAHRMVVVENIATANLMRNHHLAQAIGDQGWGELARHLGCKTTRAGGPLVVAGRRFPSSTYRCDVCTLVIERDLNAAANLAAWGGQQQGTRPVAGTHAGDRHPGGPSAQLAEQACREQRAGQHGGGKPR